MQADSTREIVKFITCETGTDLIVSFVIAADNPFGVVSLTLMRTSKFEHVLPENERGVSVSHESSPAIGGREHLQRIRIAPPVISIATTHRLCDLDVSAVGQADLETAVEVLRQMNFDNRFVLKLG